MTSSFSNSSRLFGFLLVAAFLTPEVTALGNSTLDRETDRLIRKLGGSNEAERVEARQLLPREGEKVVPGLLPLLGRSDASVAWAAEKVLADIANRVSVPGREEERRFYTEQVMALLTSESATEVKVRALGLLAVSVPEGFDVQPISALLADPHLRSNARDALQSIASAEAVEALSHAIDSADPAFRTALLDSLDKVRRPEALPALREAAREDDPNIRRIAVRGLAHWGDLADLELFDSIWENRTPELEFDAGDAFLRHTDRIAAGGGNLGLAVERYRRIFAEAKDPVLVGAAMMGMATHGDSRVIEDLLKALDRSDSSELLPQFLMALEAVRGTGANRSIARQFDRIPENLRLQSIEVFGRKRHPEFLPLLAELTESESEAERAAALNALAVSRLPGAVDALARMVGDASGDTHDFALQGLIDVAESLAREGKGNEAGRAYAVILDNAPDNQTRRIALSALARFPRIESYDSAAASLENPDFRPEAFSALASIVRVLIQANQPEKANEGFDRLSEVASSTEDIRALSPLANALGRSGEWISKSGFITQWRLIGPFPWNPPDEFEVEWVGEPSIDVSREIPHEGVAVSWKDYAKVDALGQVNLSDALGARENVTAYAFAEFDSDEELPAVFRLGSDDWVKVWFNGEAVHEHRSFRGVSLDQDQVPITVRKGRNSLLLRINQGVLGWGFVARLTHADGTPLPTR